MGPLGPRPLPRPLRPLPRSSSNVPPSPPRLHKAKLAFTPTARSRVVDENTAAATHSAVRDVLATEAQLMDASAKVDSLTAELTEWQAMLDDAAANAQLPGASASSEVMLGVLRTTVARLKGQLAHARTNADAAQAERARARSAVSALTGASTTATA